MSLRAARAWNPAAVSITGGTIDGSSLDSGSGIPTIIGKSYAAVSGAADTNENILATITVPAGAMGANGLVRITTAWTMTNGANAKTMRARIGGIGGTAITIGNGVVNIAGLQGVTIIANRNAANSQFLQSGALMSSSAAHVAAHGTAAIDTAPATTIVITGQKATAGDTLTLEGYVAELFSNGA